jgi:hypothetical protein
MRNRCHEGRLTTNVGQYVHVKGAATEKQLTESYTWVAKARRILIPVKDMPPDSEINMEEGSLSHPRSVLPN